MNKGNLLLALLCFLQPAGLFAKVDLVPYVSIKNTKTIKPVDSETEKETIVQRQEYGIRASISFWRLMKFQVGVGQSALTTTTKSQDAVDEYGEIDFEKDMDLDTSEPEKEVRVKETQRVLKSAFVLDPSFSIFVLRAKIGVMAKQRILEHQETGEEAVTITEDPQYFPLSGVGAGIRLSSKINVMAEYEFNHYKFPELEPFERQVSVSFQFSF
jgi:hypothetical protein